MSLFEDDLFGFNHTRWQLRYAMAIGGQYQFAKLPDEDLEKLPGDLPRLAKAMHTARTADERAAAADAFLVASEEYIPRHPVDRSEDDEP